MKVEFTVLHASIHEMQANVEYQGETIAATVKPLIVEMTPVDQSAGHGTLMLRFTKKTEIEDAMKTFLPGRVVAFDVEPLGDAELQAHVDALSKKLAEAAEAAKVESKPEAKITTQE